ncbi:hypothetical protein [Nostoc sp. PCC 7107]|nr:hypothetical protein [Nostoc sp. PCC 7107]
MYKVVVNIAENCTSTNLTATDKDAAMQAIATTKSVVEFLKPLC